MNKPPEKIKVARDLPPPPDLTEEDLKRIGQEAQEAREAITKATRSLERLTGDDMKIRIY
jgi:hypothetical protein